MGGALNRQITVVCKHSTMICSFERFSSGCLLMDGKLENMCLAYKERNIVSLSVTKLLKKKSNILWATVVDYCSLERRQDQADRITFLFLLTKFILCPYKETSALIVLSHNDREVVTLIV